jgi:hypothetical protein
MMMEWSSGLHRFVFFANRHDSIEGECIEGNNHWGIVALLIFIVVDPVEPFAQHTEAKALGDVEWQ